VIVESPARRRTRTVAAWAVVGLFVFPLYFWITTAFKHARHIFDQPPSVWTFEPTMKNFEQVLGVDLGFFRQQEVLPGGAISTCCRGCGIPSWSRSARRRWR
jgi:multiple sugar transport system permease protein